ncbi:hypothetical protein [Pseudomonas sp. GM17]|uniref:hypothetical protein n=1 Tax=Pseudomonas sp. GM17 TaxID=1144323 RepID=UPI0012F65CA2|nr:hypothetical protein [Pseudomonas sp. GM17]WIE49866.1 hypothetical protein PMI20_029910 [Pseudomonas sp. GM17]
MNGLLMWIYKIFLWVLGCVALFFLAGLAANFIGAIAGYNKYGVWDFGINDLVSSLRGAVFYGVPVAVGGGGAIDLGKIQKEQGW